MCKVTLLNYSSPYIPAVCLSTSLLGDSVEQLGDVAVFVLVTLDDDIILHLDAAHHSESLQIAVLSPMCLER